MIFGANNWESDWSTLGPEEKAALREQLEERLPTWRANLKSIVDRIAAADIEYSLSSSRTTSPQFTYFDKDGKEVPSNDPPEVSLKHLRAVFQLTLDEGRIRNEIDTLEKQIRFLTPPAEPVAETQAGEATVTEAQSALPTVDKPKYRRGDLTQKQAAQMCGVSIRQIQKWLAGKRTPEGFPGIYNTVTFGMWAENYRRWQQAKKTAIEMNRASSVDPKILEGCCSNSDVCGLEDVIEEQKKDMAQEKRRAKRA